jgi:peptidoglycan/xylan/chitin deacetylase (PgdA/CDA1 family)
VRTVTLKIDVDTLRGTREGAPRLAALLDRLKLPATFLFSLGPDHTGRALKRVFRRGFFSKVRRTSVVSNYGITTLMYGVLLPGPRIARRCRGGMRAIQQQGFEVGVHCHDHVKWQDGVAHASQAWTREQLRLAVREFEATFDCAPQVHGAAGWQMNPHVPRLQEEFGFKVASDTRGASAFRPAGGGVLQLPTTLPTLDELIGVAGASADDAIDRLLTQSRTGARHHVFTLHAELEGGAYLPQFERLLRAWRDEGVGFLTLGGAAQVLADAKLPVCRIAAGEVPGRSGELAVQA